jgi:hypothetical protein
MRHSPELLEAIIGSGKRCFEVREGEKHVAASEQLKRLDEARRHLIAWGNRASHTFDLVRPEAEKLIRVCEEAMAVFRCADCEKKLWFADAAAKQVQCQCSGIRWRYGKD